MGDLYRQKKDDYWLWWAIDRASKSVLGWTLGDRGTETGERLAAQLPHAAHVRFATDFWHPYAKIFGGLCGINPFASQYHLKPGRTFTTPAMLWTWSDQGKGQVSRNFHRWARRYGIRSE